LNSRVCLCVYALALLTSLFLIKLCFLYVTNSLTLVFVVLVDHNFSFLIVCLFLFRCLNCFIKLNIYVRKNVIVDQLRENFLNIFN
jgi:hypothetical protein